jgi:GMP synthase (glutamine-hydrolysing)
MRFHCIQHVGFETPGHIQSWIEDHGYSLSFTRPYLGDPFPQVDQFDALILMGGPMSVHDQARFGWLRAEKAFIAGAIQQHKKILGICLGAQLVAEALGARVYPNRYTEIGFFPVEFLSASAPLLGSLSGARKIVFHWHGDTFDLPPGAVQLARSAGCQNQAFLVAGQILGLQFHLEATSTLVQAMVEHGRQELVEGRWVQGADQILQGLANYPDNKPLLDQVLSAFLIDPIPVP